MAREATRRGSQRRATGSACWSGSASGWPARWSSTSRSGRWRETLVPQFADHCFIDLLQGDKLIRRAQLHSRGWMPEPGTWALVGEPITYPEGHFCQQAMARQDTVVVADMRTSRFPAPSAASLEACDDVGLTSVIAAPLIARGELLGVMSLALSDADRARGAALRRRRRRLPVRDRQPGGDRHRQRHAVRGGAPHRAGLPDQPAAARPAARSTAWRSPTSTCRPSRWRPTARASRPRSAATGTTSSRCRPGRVGIVIGDVEGRGARAAAVMGQLRAALRAFAQDDKPPAEILRRLDDWCRTLGPRRRPSRTASPPPTRRP